MSLLTVILQEIENEMMTNKDIGRKQCEGMCRAMKIIHAHLDECPHFWDTSHVYECSQDLCSDVVPASKEFLEGCALTSKKYKKSKNPELVRKIEEINTELQDYLLGKYFLEGYDETLDTIVKKYVQVVNDVDLTD